MLYSVIIPTLNEGGRIGELVRYLKHMGEHLEVIVVDGGSVDGTREKAYEAGATVVKARTGRGTQCNMGVRYAHGEVFVFLHADTVLPPDALTIFDKFFTEPEHKIGTFKIRFIPPVLLLDMVWIFTGFDSIITSFGDQCIVIRREFFKEIGGFPDWPLFEDVKIFQKARRLTKIYSLPGTVFSSSRRFNKNTVIHRLIWNGWLIFLYLLGWDPEKLARMYNRNLM
jgi:rSAM/selenodomain-associated transferase 2